MSKEEKIEKKLLNDEVLKGVLVDGFEFLIGQDYTILDCGIAPPRSKERIIVARILFPTRMVEGLINGLSKAWEEQKKTLKTSKE